MDWAELATTWAKLLAAAFSVMVPVLGGWWAFEKWRRRDEHFPRIELETSVNFIGCQQGKIVCELVAWVENKGVVPLKYKKFTLVLRGLSSEQELAEGGSEIRGQLSFSRKLVESSFIPAHWQYSFIYPGVRTEYNFVAAIPDNTTFVRMQADLVYLGDYESHHAAKVLKVPDDLRSCAADRSATLPAAPARV